MKNKVEHCIACQKKNLDKDSMGINKKLIGENVNTYYCMDCLADYLGCTIQNILDKIEEFKEEGCKLFK
jgi:biotin operon repressor